MKSWRYLAVPVLAVLTILGWSIGRAVWTSLQLESGTDGRSSEFIGLDNYAGTITSAQWWQAVGILAAWTTAVVLGQLVVGSVMAATLHQLTAVSAVLRVLVLTPFAVFSIAAATGALAAVDGGFLAQWAGIESAAGPLRTLIAIGLAEVWRGSGVVAVILIAGLSRTSKELRQWLHGEGATRFQVLAMVIIPAALPAVIFAILFRVLDTWRGFGSLWARAMHQGRADVPQVMIANTTFDRFEYGLASAMAIVFLLLTLLLGTVAGLMLHWSRTRSRSDGGFGSRSGSRIRGSRVPEDPSVTPIPAGDGGVGGSS